MKKCIIIPDSFKGSLSSREVCDIMGDSARRHFPGCEVRAIPIADGGEGSVDAFLAALGGERVALAAKGPYMEDIEAYYGLLPGGGTAVIEMASCAGLSLVGADRRAEKTTTYGVGQLMVNAARRGCTKIIMALGGSATNDFGAGAAAAAGIEFFDEEGRPFLPVGETLERVCRIDKAGLDPALAGVEIVTMCDIDNPLYGENGAAHVFAPQKGAGAQTVALLDRGLRRMARVAKRDLGADVSALPGAGAAGGMGGGMVAFFGARLQMGIETLLDAVRFDALLDGADLVFSGEGRIDGQSLRGKVVIGVARRAKRAGVPLIAVVGGLGEGYAGAYGEGVTAIFSINHEALPLEAAIPKSRVNLEIAMDNILRLLAL